MRAGRLLRLRHGEWVPVLWSAALFYCLLCAYYLIRPLRDAMGVSVGVDRLQWVFSATFVVMLAAVPAYGWLASRYGRARLVPIVYLVCGSTLVAFYLAFRLSESVAVAGAFFVWTSVFNLFVVSVFWTLMADLYNSGQARRLFALIAAGGSAGAMSGPLITALLVPHTGELLLLPLAAALLGLAYVCFDRLRRRLAMGETAESGQGLGGSIWAGLSGLAGSRYLAAIAGFVLLLTTLATFVYFTQAQIIGDAFASRAERTEVFAWIDLAVNVLTLLLQGVITVRIIERIGVGGALALLPAVVALGFAALTLAPVLPVLLVFQVIRRAGNYGVTRPAREILYTVVDREHKYKTKNVIDTLVYRGGDAASGWLYAGLKAVGFNTAGIALLAIPLALSWMVLGLWLGRAHQARQTLAQEHDP